MPRAPSSSTLQTRRPIRWMGLGTVRAQDVPDYHHQFSNVYVTEQDTLLNGRIKALQVHPDIWIHAVEGCDLRTFTSRTMVQHGLHIVMVLEGCVDVAFGTLPLQLQFQPNPSDGTPQASAALLHTCQQESFVRHWRKGKFERKLSMRVHPRLVHSLAHTCGYTHLQNILEQHLYLQRWQPSARAMVLAEQIMHLSGQESSALLLQSRTLELLHEVVHQPHHDPISATTCAPAPLHLREHMRIAKLKALIDAQQDANACVSELAHGVGLSASALQRHFRQLYGCSVDVYRRTQRLKQARALLEQTGCSVLEVAHISGYTSAANFSTAFKRYFGISPKLVRGKL